MYHCTVNYAKTPAKIGTPGSTRMLATARTLAIAQQQQDYTVETPMTLAGTSTATVWSPKTIDFEVIRKKIVRNAKNSQKKTQKEEKLLLFVR